MRAPHRLQLALVFGSAAGAAWLALRVLSFDTLERAEGTEPVAVPSKGSLQLPSLGIARRPVQVPNPIAPAAPTAVGECLLRAESFASHRLEAVSGTSPSRVVLEIVDEKTRAKVTGVRVLRTGPGLVAERLVGACGEASFEVRQRLPFDLRIEAEGYEPEEIRQTRLQREEAARTLLVPLRARR